ncbi:hypothetical protein HK405_012420 [Cladochytrium tenue]|nr:hypothetical protein HK405_012420 [Cladochytrium tenue]
MQFRTSSPAAAGLAAAAATAALVVLAQPAAAAPNLRLTVPAVAAPSTSGLSRRDDSAAVPTPASTLVLPAVAGDALALRMGWSSSSHSLLNSHAYPAQIAAAVCDTAAGTLTLSFADASAVAAAGAANWAAPLLVAVQDASCGVLPAGDADADACLATTCACDADLACPGTLICESGACAAQPDVTFFNVTGPASVAASGADVTFAGAALTSTELNSALTLIDFEYTSIRPASSTSSSSSSSGLSRRSPAAYHAMQQQQGGLQRRSVTCAYEKWWFVTYGFDCSAPLPQTASIDLSVAVSSYLDADIAVTSTTDMVFDAALFSANGSGLQIQWDSWTVEADFGITAAFDASYTWSEAFAIPDLGWSVSGSWGSASIGVYVTPSVTVGAVIDVALTVPVTVDLHSGTAGAGTGVFANSSVSASPTVELGTVKFASNSSVAVGVELKLSVGASVDVTGIADLSVTDLKVSADLFAAARLEGIVETGSTMAAACVAENADLAVEGKYGYEVGVEYSLPYFLPSGSYDFVGAPGYPYSLGAVCESF